MSSSQPFIPSSPLSLTSTGRRRKSRFTFKHLNLLSQASTNCPLRVIAHIDLDAFYAQCEMVRLGVAEDKPLAVQQWQGLIAINYPARRFGLNRHITITEAKKLCPELIMQHVATWREGDDKWAYREDSFQHIATDKVSLDPYRLQSRKILATIKDALPGHPIQRVEKASIDEVFLDLSAQIHSILLERYPELAGPPPYDDPTENLPPPPTTALDWQADALVDLDPNQTEDDDPDWDDIAMLVGSEIVRSVRTAVREHLHYTCSAGIARNKMMAKLGSGHKKPNSQTVVRNRAIQHFLSAFKFTKIRNLGGKLGDQIVSTFSTDELVELLKIPVEQLKSKLGDDTGTWLHGIIRGEDHSEVNSRTQLKSMLSAKSFRPSINSYEQAERWLRIFAADIYSRLVEEGVVENKRRPKTINLHHRQGGQTRSRQLPIPSGRKIEEATLHGLAQTLLGQVIVDGRAWPCGNLSLSVGGFEDGVTGNRGIGSFLVRGDEAKAMNTSVRAEEPQTSLPEVGRPEKRRKVEDEGLRRFFGKQESTGEHDDDSGVDDHQARSSEHGMEPKSTDSDEPDGNLYDGDDAGTSSSPHEVGVGGSSSLQQQPITSYFCEDCGRSIPETGRSEHQDWHFAKDLQSEDRSGEAGVTNKSAGPSRPAKTVGQLHGKTPNTKGHRGSGAGPRGGPRGTEKGQSRLAFGS